MMHRWKSETLDDLGLDELGSTLVPAIRVLFEDCGVVLVRVLAAFKHHGYDWLELSPSIPGVVDMGWGL